MRRLALLVALVSLACGVKAYPRPPRPEAAQPAPAAAPAASAPPCTNCAAPDGGARPESP